VGGEGEWKKKTKRANIQQGLRKNLGGKKNLHRTECVGAAFEGQLHRQNGRGVLGSVVWGGGVTKKNFCISIGKKEKKSGGLDKGKTAVVRLERNTVEKRRVPHVGTPGEVLSKKGKVISKSRQSQGGGKRVISG